MDLFDGQHMLYGNESISHYSKSNVLVWMAMAFQGGLLNIGGFLACHRFVSHITGFAAFLAVDLSQKLYSHAIGMLAVPGFFLVGAMVSGQLIDVRLQKKKKPHYFVSFGLIFCLITSTLILGLLGQFGTFGEALDRKGYILLVMLCLACGLQNGAISTVSKSVVRTTHLTGLTTDLGLGIMRVLNAGRLPRLEDNEVRANLMRIGIIIFFTLGSILGAFLYLAFGFWGFLLPSLTSGLLFMLMIYFQIVRKPKERG